MRMELQELMSDYYYYATSPSFRVGFEDELDIQLGILYEMTDMYDATGDEKFEDYPYVVEACIVADEPGPETEDITKTGMDYAEWLIKGRYQND